MKPHVNTTTGPLTRRRGRVGLVGIGLMGSALAERLIDGGMTVLGYDINPSRCELLAALGGEPVDGAPAVARHCDQIVLSLPDSSVVEETLAVIGGGGLTADRVIVDTTTGDPLDAAAFGDRLAGRGGAYLDATISGSSAQVRAGNVTVMVGGPEPAFSQCRPLFGTFARNMFHIGPCGSGSRMKLLTNLVLGLNRAALAEGLAFARAMGIDPAQALSMLRESMAYSRIMDTKGQKMVSGDFEPDARLSQHLKDVRLILEAAGEAGARLPLSRTHQTLLETAEAAGLGPLDNSAIFRAFDLLAPQPAAQTSA
jgi:3-hydroxyisobutyrate dehydrogenase-like beta-hydroxyacid dehydrogenase